MDAEQKLLLRHAILRQIAAAAPVAMPPATRLHGVALAGFRLDDRSLQIDLD